MPAAHESIASILKEALKYNREDNLERAEKLCLRVLEQDPSQPDALHLLGMIYYKTGRYDVAAEYIEKAVSINPLDSDYYNNLGIIYKSCSQFQRAVDSYIKAIALAPERPYYYFNLGNVLCDMERFDEAVGAYLKALEVKPDYAEACNNLATTLQATGKPSEAHSYFQKAVQINPGYIEAHINMGNCLRDMGRFDEALSCYHKAMVYKENSAEAYYNAGVVLHDTGNLDGAIVYYLEALKYNPDYAAAHNNLGNMLAEKGLLSEAIAHYRKTLTLLPDDIETYNNLGNALKDQGNLSGAAAMHRQSLVADPHNHRIHSNLLYDLHYTHELEPGEMYQEHLGWAKQHAGHLLPDKRVYKNPPEPDRRLRIGYMSPDFRNHSVAFFIEPVLASHDHTRFEIFCYSDVVHPDGVTQRLKSVAHVWRDIRRMTDEYAAELINDDGIDILIDLAGHTANNRMLVFARKPAPVQITYLGYPNTTGLAAMDYRLTDALADPPGVTDTFYTEQLVRMPEGFLCYLPPPYSLAPAEPPVLKSGAITFGCFNNLSKISSDVIAVWSRILQRLPEARIIIKAKALCDDEAKNMLKEKFNGHGISGERLLLTGYIPSATEHLLMYNSIDISLDTFPYNGTTTTCESLWMGVPVITFEGTSHVSRVGVSLLSQTGLHEFIAQDSDQYVDIAVELADTTEKLRALRAGLRDRLKASFLTNPHVFIHHLEAVYRMVWEKWCNQNRG